MIKKIREEELYKKGESVKGRKAVIHDINGEAVVGEVIYRRKAIYNRIGDKMTEKDFKK